MDVAIAEAEPQRLRFVLGTEAGMVTAIVRGLRERLNQHPEAGVEIEIIFPVASEAIATTTHVELPIIPGVSGGEGCSTAGGCATCPYMKMNSLDALFDLLEKLPEAGRGLTPAARAELAAFEPRKYQEHIDGHTLAELGSEPILHMRAFQGSGRLPDDLVADMRAR
ncbi:MAG: hypothetical protein HC927_07510 [Deltaproteobacteria bacterium]|nr:hypothetical protein [Deltaproteobacteria bacterium]